MDNESEVLPPSKHTPIELTCRPDDENHSYFIYITFSDGVSFKCSEWALRKMVEKYVENDCVPIPA